MFTRYVSVFLARVRLIVEGRGVPKKKLTKNMTWVGGHKEEAGGIPKGKGQAYIFLVTRMNFAFWNTRTENAFYTPRTVLIVRHPMKRGNR